MSGHGFQFPSSFQLRSSLKKLSAASSSVFRFLFKASQALDVGSIPIARSIRRVNKRLISNLATIQRLATIQPQRNALSSQQVHRLLCAANLPPRARTSATSCVRLCGEVDAEQL